jgi:DNA-binding transcriptional LysR family regulator
MSKFDYSDLDGHLLRLLRVVVDTGSVTAAAAQLGVTQSAVSHQLDKLRAITGEALFVKSGRGIVATARARALAEQARQLLHGLQAFSHPGAFEPAQWRGLFTVAANDFQRDLLLPRWLARVHQQAPGLSLRVLASDIPSLDMLRNDLCDMVISPRPPDGSDIVQKRLFEDAYAVFFDPQVRKAPAHLADFLAADHATVVYAPQRPLELDKTLAAQGVHRHFVVTVPGFGALPAFVRGTSLLATGPRLLAHTTFKGLAHCPVPVPCPTLPMYMVWHARYQQDAAHTWLRAQLVASVEPALTQWE